MHSHNKAKDAALLDIPEDQGHEEGDGGCPKYHLPAPGWGQASLDQRRIQQVSKKITAFLKKRQK